MNREEFMKELEYLLSDIPDEEKAEAIGYYRDYLEEVRSASRRLSVPIYRGIWRTAESLRIKDMRTNGSAIRITRWRSGMIYRTPWKGRRQRNGKKRERISREPTVR